MSNTAKWAIAGGLLLGCGVGGVAINCTQAQQSRLQSAIDAVQTTCELYRLVSPLVSKTEQTQEAQENVRKIAAACDVADRAASAAERLLPREAGPVAESGAN